MINDVINCLKATMAQSDPLSFEPTIIRLFIYYRSSQYNAPQFSVLKLRFYKMGYILSFLQYVPVKQTNFV